MTLKGRARVAPRYSSTSDESRPRSLLGAALAAAVAIAAGLAFAPSGTLSSPGPLSLPHANAKLECASCHGKPARERSGGEPVSDRVRVGTDACVSCHGEHALRGGHARVTAESRMTCATCHSAHAAETVSFVRDGRHVHTANGLRLEGQSAAIAPGTHVPVLRAERCVGCHDPTRPGDPLRPCVDEAGILVRCLGEHDRSASPGRVCAAQHDPARFAARDAAARVVTGSKGANLARSGGIASWLGLGPIAAGLVWFVGARIARRRRKPSGSPKPTAVSAVRRLPVIDASRCLGCYACVDACAFDVLEVERYVAKVARPDACCSATTCAEACPNGSLVMQDEGASESAERRVHIGATMESETTPGVYLVGDVTGVPLIRNAIVQGRTAIDAIYDRKKRARDPRALQVEADVLIVGAGPAGLAASLRAEERGLTYVTLEQSSVAASIKSFPRGKLVFDAPIDLPLEGEIAVRECTKEELVAHWTRIVRTRRPRILEQHRVTTVTREGDTFAVVYERADGSQGTVRAGAVVVAIGQRGTPRRLEANIAPSAESMVADALFDARSFAGQHVVIAGLGDAAMEAAQALAHQPGTRITMVHRGEGFSRGRAKNIEETKALVEAGRIQMRWNAAITEVYPGKVVITCGSHRDELEADAVLALLGGTPSRALLEALGVEPQNFRPSRA